MPIISNQLGKRVSVRSTANDVVTLAQTAISYGPAFAFNANTSVNATADFISFTPNKFIYLNEPVRYLCATGNTANIGLTNNSIYYVVFSNSSGIAVSTSKNGANVNLSQGATESGHTLTLTEDVQGLNVAKIYWSIPDNGTGNYINVARSSTTLLRLTSSDSFDFSGEGVIIDADVSAANVDVSFVGNQNASCVVELHKKSVHRGDQPI